MSNQEIIEKLIEIKMVYPIYENGNVSWIVEFPGGGELIGDEGFTWDDICELYREQIKP
jgi:hypothetical protein